MWRTGGTSPEHAQAQTWNARRRLARSSGPRGSRNDVATGGTGGLVMIGLGVSIAATGRRD